MNRDLATFAVTGGSTFERLFAWVSVVAPNLLTVLAFLAAPDSATRAQILVPGMQWIVAALVAALVLRAAYALGLRAGNRALRGAGFSLRAQLAA